MNTIKTSELAARLTAEREANGTGKRPSHTDLTCAISAELRKLGIPHSEAQSDEEGRCFTCGEVGYDCPGVHTFEEIQAAGRVAIQDLVELETTLQSGGLLKPSTDRNADKQRISCPCTDVGVTNCIKCVENGGTK